MTVLVRHSFTGSDGANVTGLTPVTGSALVAVNGDLKVFNNRATVGSGGPVGGLATQDTLPNDYTAKITLKWLGGASYAALGVRYTAPNDFYDLFISETQIALGRHIGAAYKVFATKTWSPVSGTDYVFEVRVESERITASQDSVQLFPAVLDPFVTAGGAVRLDMVVYAGGSTTTGFSADELLVETITPAPTRQLATRCLVNGDPSSGYASTMTGGVSFRSWHKASEAISALKLSYWNGYMNYLGGGIYEEIGIGAPLFLETSIEYPASTFTRVQWAGANVGEIASEVLGESDFASVSIPKGAEFWVHSFQTCASGVVYSLKGSSSVLGDRMSDNGSSLVMSGSVPNSYPDRVHTPVAIHGVTSKRAVLLVGTSRTVGSYDTYDASGDLGNVARSIGPKHAYLSAAMPADGAEELITYSAYRRMFANYATDVIIDHGINDNLMPDIQGWLETLFAYYAGRGLYVHACTQSPATSGAWTLTNGSDQTTVLHNMSAQRAWLLTVPSPLTRVFDINSITALAGNEQKWNAPGYTADGIHESHAACLAIQASGIVFLVDEGPRIWTTVQSLPSGLGTTIITDGSTIRTTVQTLPSVATIVYDEDALA